MVPAVAGVPFIQSVTSLGASLMGAMVTASSCDAPGRAVTLCSPASAVAMHAQTPSAGPAHVKQCDGAAR